MIMKIINKSSERKHRYYYFVNDIFNRFLNKYRKMPILDLVAESFWLKLFSIPIRHSTARPKMMFCKINALLQDDKK